MKNIAVNLALSSNDAIASQALGLEEVPPFVRQSEGSLVASLLSLVANPLAVFITKTRILAFDQLVDGVVPALADVRALLLSNEDVTYTHEFLALPSNLKSRPLSVDGNEVVISATLGGLPPSGSYVAGVMVPTTPTYTALSLVNRLIALADSQDPAEEYVILVDQNQEKVYFYAYGAFADSQLTSALAAEAALASPFAAFTLSDPVAGEEEGSTGWE